ncbi:cadherin 26 [Solea senegalensis]|uniref:Cadherin 26 n=1 Tax=Solea senegalensis TaxID=28829 RepID=A0AAV6SUW0_SOLSE|nr:cadherin-like protein 26 isoform X2 [Solea senegalensis]KAG7521306.1 cadherin 26 [Solea senegalensis]
MRTVSMLLLVFVGCMSESHNGNRSARAKRELLLRSKRRWVLSTIELKEETPGPYPKIISHMFNDKKDRNSERQRFKLSGTGVTEKPLGVFSVNEETGEVYVHKPVDREENALFHLKFEILDKDTGLQIDRELSIDIDIMDINDNAPTFDKSRYTADIKENSEEGYLPVQLHATDRDQSGTPNSNITISVISQKPQQPVIALKQIDDRMAWLTLAGCFNYDKTRNYEVIVQAKDQGTPPSSSTAVISLNIVDTNTHPPVFKETKYKGEVLESTKGDVLRVAVEDKDTPNTPGWRAKYFFINGNEDGAFQIETDPETNEGILSVLKEMDFERTSLLELQIGVKNEETLFVCKDKSTGTNKLPPPDSVTVKIEVIDINDPPQFKKEISHVYQREEESPGKLLFTPEVHDDDSDVNNIRYVLLHDPAKWMGIDAKTGQIKTIEIMDRESPFVEDSIYNITIGAIDDGKPQATGTCIVLVHLKDINDNTPRLVNNHVIMCGNKVNKVMIAAGDTDDHPYSGPFMFSLRDDDGTLKRLWKLDPSIGEEGGLVSLKTLPYGNYTVPLVIQDQQSMRENSTLGVTVCDCGEASVCRRKEPLSTSGGASCIAVIFAGLLLFLLLLLIFMCECGKKTFHHGPIAQDEGNQTLIKYNQEGGGAESMTKPVLPSIPTNGVPVTEGLKKATRQVSEKDTGMITKKDAYNTQNMNLNNSKMGAYQMDSDFRGLGRQNRYSSWSTNRSNSFHQGRGKRYQRSLSLQSQQYIIDHIDKKLPMLDGGHVEYPQYQPYKYAYEGEGSTSQSLDKLSIGNLGDDLQFLNDLEPKFKALGNICHRAIQEKEHAALKNTAGK